MERIPSEEIQSVTLPQSTGSKTSGLKAVEDIEKKRIRSSILADVKMDINPEHITCSIIGKMRKGRLPW